MTSQELAYIIARNRGLDIGVVRKQRSINPFEAIERYFSQETREKLIQQGKYFPDGPKNRIQELRNLGLALSIRSYQAEFYKTPEGRLWFDCNVPTGEDMSMLCAEISDDNREYAQIIRIGQTETWRKLHRRRPHFIG